MSEPDFWDRREQAQGDVEEVSSLRNIIQPLLALERQFADYEVLVELAAAEAEFAKTKLTFLQGFTAVTTGGRDEYVDLILGYPSNAAALYASAMLKLRRDYGGDEWVKGFFNYLRKCPSIPWVADLNDSGTAQGLNWLVAEPSMVQWPELCTRGASSLARSVPPHSKSSTASTPT